VVGDARSRGSRPRACPRQCKQRGWACTRHISGVAGDASGRPWMLGCLLMYMCRRTHCELRTTALGAALPMWHSTSPVSDISLSSTPTPTASLHLHGASVGSQSVQGQNASIVVGRWRRRRRFFRRAAAQWETHRSLDTRRAHRASPCRRPRSQSRQSPHSPRSAPS
jgi:hypothetical protein